MMILALILGLLPVVAYADEPDEENIYVRVQYNDENIPEENQVNVGVFNISPDDEDNQIQSVNRPTKVWNIKTKGKYAMTVKAKRLTKTYASTKISSGKSATVTFSNIKSDTAFYLTFSGSSFSGYIK